VLLADDGGRLPKHVGGKITCTYTICFACASSWCFNKLHGINNITTVLGVQVAK
jgi:hypothetical protein